jgi:hypothetical protein
MNSNRVTYGGTVWLYEESQYTNPAGGTGTARYILGTEGTNPLLVFGINPSTATPGNLDNTVERVAAITPRLGHDSWIMLNVYPQRATNPDDVDASLVQQIHDKNVEVIAGVIKDAGQDVCHIIAAWGDIIAKRGYLTGCLRDIARAITAVRGKQIIWHSFGETEKLHNPRHPLYVKADDMVQAFQQTFDLGAYLTRKGAPL